MKIYRLEREKELIEERKKKEYEDYKNMMIEMEKERLIAEHAPNLDGFLPKGLLQKEKDLNYLGQNKYSKNQSTFKLG